MQRSSAIDGPAEPEAAGSAANDQAVGHRFAEALGRKDFAAVIALLDPAIDFRGLTPERVWEAPQADAVGDDILRRWFEDTDELEKSSRSRPTVSLIASESPTASAVTTQTPVRRHAAGLQHRKRRANRLDASALLGISLALILVARFATFWGASPRVAS